MRPFEGVRVAALAGQEQGAQLRGGSYFFSSSPCGSSFLIARNPVGAVKKMSTRACWAQTRQ